MRAFALSTGLLGGAAALLFLSSAQLIWARSESSYYLQFALACGCLAGLLFLARRASARLLCTLVVAAALMIALMPIENTSLPLSGGHAKLFDRLSAVASPWLFYAVLLGLWTFGWRRWLAPFSRLLRSDMPPHLP